MGPSFSRRYGFRGPRGITIREDAPEGLRIGYLQIAHDEFQLSYTQIRILVCRVLRKFPDFSNWSEIPNVRDEVADCLQTCDWYLIYDIIEATYRQLAPQGTAEAFAKRINELLEEEGIGWQLINGEILT